MKTLLSVAIVIVSITASSEAWEHTNRFGNIQVQVPKYEMNMFGNMQTFGSKKLHRNQFGNLVSKRPKYYRNKYGNMVKREPRK